MSDYLLDQRRAYLRMLLATEQIKPEMVAEASFAPRIQIKWGVKTYRIAVTREQLDDLRWHGIEPDRIMEHLTGIIVDTILTDFPVAAFRAVKLKRILKGWPITKNEILF